MTTFLSPVVPSLFDKRFKSPYHPDGQSKSLQTVNVSLTSIGTVLVNRSRQISKTSATSTISTPASLNHENVSLPSERFGPFGLTSKMGQPCVRNCSAPATPTRDRAVTPSNWRPAGPPNQDEPGRSAHRNQTECSKGEDIVRRALAELQQSRCGREKLSDVAKMPARQLPSFEHPTHDMKWKFDPRPQTPPPKLTLSSNERKHFCQADEPQPTQELHAERRRHKQVSLSPANSSYLTDHRSRLSDASSAFVHTIKTASISNASFSLLPRSLRFGRSSDAPAHSSNARYSVDSERPSTNSSLDEAAIRRGVKRHRIIQEIIGSEESYLADVRALVYLYTTLLASASSLSNQTRSSIQRNVTDILHLHENLVEELHRMTLKAANRKWADTASPCRLGFGQHLRWRSLEPTIAPRSERKHRRTRSSLESVEIPQAFTRLRTADPAEVVHVARIFKTSMSRFFVYEEYCAKYEIIVAELHSYVPRWSSFETGIEALNKSITALNSRDQDDRKAMAVKDLLVKPIQRVCKYPLLLQDLLRNTHVADCPTAHAEIEFTLQCFRDVVQEINRATGNPVARRQIQRRWLLHDRLIFQDKLLQANQFRSLGHAQLCGVLHTAWNSKSRVDGCYALCLLFDSYFILAIPAGATGKFNIMAVIHLSDLKIDSASDGKGLQCHTALFTWKLSLEADGQLYEMILSACSTIEENQWIKHLQRKPGNLDYRPLPTAVSPDLNLKPAGLVFGQAATLTRRLSIQRAATVGNRASICQVIVRNTHNPQDLQDFRNPSHSTINRSQSHATTRRVVVLAPKRSERARLEAALANVWTRDTIPYPGMVASRGGQIIRASAGSLVRKLSLASLHGPFTRRSSSLTLAHRNSYEAFIDARKESEITSTPLPVFEVKKKDSHDELVEMEQETDARAWPVNTQAGNRTVSNTSKRLSLNESDGGIKRGALKTRRLSKREAKVGPEDSAKGFYASVEAAVVEDKFGSRKRWSNPIGLLKNLSADSIRHMLYSSR